VELLYFVLCAYGMSFIIVHGSIFKNIRPEKNYDKLWNTLFHCPLCIGFHCGWFLVLLSPYTELWNYQVSLANMFCLACVSAGMSYFLSMIVDDFGLRINKDQ
jgi:hypothetical protein